MYRDGFYTSHDITLMVTDSNSIVFWNNETCLKDVNMNRDDSCISTKTYLVADISKLSVFVIYSYIMQYVGLFHHATGGQFDADSKTTGHIELSFELKHLVVFTSTTIVICGVMAMFYWCYRNHSEGEIELTIDNINQYHTIVGLDVGPVYQTRFPYSNSVNVSATYDYPTEDGGGDYMDMNAAYLMPTIEKHSFHDTEKEMNTTSSVQGIYTRCQQFTLNWLVQDRYKYDKRGRISDFFS